VVKIPCAYRKLPRAFTQSRTAPRVSGAAISSSETTNWIAMGHSTLNWPMSARMYANCLPQTRHTSYVRPESVKGRLMS
jgi:hypothetical protein